MRLTKEELLSIIFPDAPSIWDRKIADAASKKAWNAAVKECRAFIESCRMEIVKDTFDYLRAKTGVDKWRVIYLPDDPNRFFPKEAP